MKKIIISIMALVMIMSYGIISSKAEEIETQKTKETISLIDKERVSFSNVDFDLSNYTSTGYQTLLMGSSTTYTMNLSNILQYAQYYDHQNVSGVFIEFDLQAVYTTATSYQWLSDNTKWDKTTKRLDLETALPNTVDVEVWWNIIGQGGSSPSTSTGGLRVYSINLVIEYIEPIDLFINVSDWSQLPGGSKTLESYASDGLDLKKILSSTDMIPVSMESMTGNKKDIIFNFATESYIAKGVTLPSAINDKPISFSYYLGTSDAKILIFLFDINTYDPWDSDFLIWNLETGEFNEALTETVYGIATVRGDGWNTHNMMYVDITIPWELDDLISATIKYTYRYYYLVGGFGEDIEVVQQTLFQTGTSQTEIPWYRIYTKIVLNGLLDFATKDIFKRSEILDVTGDYNLSKKNEFTGKLNDEYGMALTQSQIFTPGTKVYELFLGQKNKAWTTGVEVDDIVLMNIRYMNNGVEYSKTMPNQKIVGSELDVSDDDSILDRLWAFIASIWLISCVIIALLATKLTLEVFPFAGKKKLLVVAVAGLYFYLLYFSFVPK